MILHATAVVVQGRAVLIRGRPGAGKSSLAIAMLARGAGLVADDRVLLSREGGALIASAPATIAGLIEARGIGLLRVAPAAPAAVALVVDLDRAPAARMPQAERITYLGTEIELINGKGIPHLDAILMLLFQNGRETA